MTLLAPGSAQLVAGNRRLGWLALCVWAVTVGAALLVVLTGLARPGAVISLVTDPAVLEMLRVALIVLALGWAALLVDAWRLGAPLRLQQRHRLVVSSLDGVLCLAVAGSLFFASHLVAVQKDLIETVFGTGTAAAPDDGRYNVLLLGGDSGPSRTGLRPDSITVASIDAETGRTVLFGLPRNLANVPFPEGSAMHERFPNGFDCAGCYLNAVYTWANDHAGLFAPRVSDPGLEATRQAVEAITGLRIGYSAMVDLRGFRELVDALGGVRVHVPERLPIGGVGGAITGWIAPGTHRLDGFQALWFARSRATSDDYSRMARQKCLLSSLLQQADPRTVMIHFEAVARAGQQMLTTDIPASELDRFVQLALQTRRLPVATVSFVPPLVQTYDPDFEQIAAAVQRALDRSERVDSGDPARRDHARPRGGSDRRYRANSTADLATAC